MLSISGFSGSFVVHFFAIFHESWSLILTSLSHLFWDQIYLRGNS
jgi:hypothetical protein